jgi:acetyl esterase/lipase
VNLIHSCPKRLIGTYVSVLHTRFVQWTKPPTCSLPLGTLADLARSKSELIAENALLRQQLIILKRQVKRPTCTKTDRILLVPLARAVRAWKQALFIVQPETLLRWHREVYRLFWRRRSKVPYAGKLEPLLAGTPETVPERYALFSPISHVHPGCPPTLLIQGENDSITPVTATRLLAEQLVAAGVATVNIVFPHTDHAFDLVLPRWSPPAQTALYYEERFLALVL